MVIIDQTIKIFMDEKVSVKRELDLDFLVTLVIATIISDGVVIAIISNVDLRVVQVEDSNIIDQRERIYLRYVCSMI